MKLFVWDFHGVLEKDNDLAVLDISNKVLEEAGYSERFSEDDNRNFYGLKWFQYFEKLLPDLTNEQHMALQAACFKFAEKNLDILAKHIKPSDHSLAVLKAIHVKSLCGISELNATFFKFFFNDEVNLLLNIHIFVIVRI